MSQWKSWSGITEYLKLAGNNPRYAPFVAALLNIIPTLQADEGIAQAEPGLTHLTLTLTVPNARRKIHIDLDSPGHYNIYMDRPLVTSYGGAEGYGERVVVPFEQVAPTVKRYLVRLRLESMGETGK